MSTLTQTQVFRRLYVDHMVRGVTRVWWQLSEDFNDPLPYTSQLQVGQTGNNAASDWADVGAPVVNTLYADDEDRRAFGRELTVHYRVLLTTPVGQYLSPPCPVFGLLPEKDWLFAREIFRKETLRFNKVGRPGYLIQRYRFGKPCPRCRTASGLVTDSRCPVCQGVGYDVGYHAPLPYTLFDIDVNEHGVRRQAASPATAVWPVRTMARAIGFPVLFSEDVWVDARSDERYYLGIGTTTAAVRGVPIVYQQEIRLAPFSDQIYRLPVGGEGPADVGITDMPQCGTGSLLIDHNYGGTDALRYVAPDNPNCGIVGAKILAIPQADYDAGHITEEYACAVGHTGANGRWTCALALNPGEYVLVFAKPPEYGPDTAEITVDTTDGVAVDTALTTRDTSDYTG